MKTIAILLLLCGTAWGQTRVNGDTTWVEWSNWREEEPRFMEIPRGEEMNQIEINQHELRILREWVLSIKAKIQAIEAFLDKKKKEGE